MTRMAGVMLQIAVPLTCAGLVAAGAVALLGPPPVVREQEVARFEQGVPGATKAAPVEPHDTVFVVRRETNPDTAAATPDPLALRSSVLAGEPLRVLSPDAIEVVAQAPPRRSRPLRLSLRIRGGRAADTVTHDGDVILMRAVAGELRGELELPRLEGESVPLSVEWRGVRDRRSGRVRARFRVAVGPVPGFWFGPGVDAAPLAEALRVQGFQQRSRRADCDVAVMSMRHAPPPGVVAEIDAGLGCLLVASEPGLHRGWAMLAPVVRGSAPVAKPIDAQAGSSSSSGARRASERPRDEARDKPIAKVQTPPDPRPLRRIGDVADRERELAKARRKRVKTKAVALVLVVDRSLSMLDYSRMKMAKRGALATGKALGEGDEIAVVSFGETEKVVLPLMSATRQQKLEQALDSLRATGQTTRCHAALVLAWEILKTTDAPVRHIVLLTDGEFFDKLAGYEETLSAMKEQGIGLTGLGVSDAGGLEKGRFVFLSKQLESVGFKFAATKRADEIPSLMLGEVREVLAGARPMKAGGGPPRDEPAPAKPTEAESAVGTEPDPPDRPAPRPELAKPTAHRLQVVDIEPVLAGIPTADWPAVPGYAPFEARARARVHVAVGALGHIWLATAPYGLGRVAVWSAGSSEWVAPVARKPWFPKLAGQLLSWLLPAKAERKLPFVSRIGGEILEGDGLAPEVLAALTDRLGSLAPPSTAVARTGETPRRVSFSEAGSALPWLLGILGGLLM
ncbi:MAG: hypothetical protein CMJ85_02970, partial [Planctomycetes bacterium]|nr:hypothetical protein [Planctomycetota bacterium]